MKHAVEEAHPLLAPASTSTTTTTAAATTKTKTAKTTTTTNAAHVSSRLPTSAEITGTVARCVFSALACVAIVWLAVFVCLCVLLARANTSEVRLACPGFWDFMLAAIFAPAAIPCLYCAVACCLWVAWRPFYGACSLVMGLACLHISLVASESAGCVEALRRTSEPLPWLLYAGYVKGALFTAGAMSVLAAHARAPPPPAASPSNNNSGMPDFF